MQYKYIQILLLWNLYGPASWNVRKVPEFVVSICRPWNSKWYNSSFGARSVSSFSWSFMTFFFFFRFYIWDILFLLVNNLCPMKRMIFLQHKIASRNLFKCVPYDCYQPFEIPRVWLPEWPVITCLTFQQIILYQSRWNLVEVVQMFGCF